MTIDEQIQWLKDNGYWRDFLIEVANASEAHINSEHYRRTVIHSFSWVKAITCDWIEVINLMKAAHNLKAYKSHEEYLGYIEQWKQEYPELFI